MQRSTTTIGSTTPAPNSPLASGSVSHHYQQPKTTSSMTPPAPQNDGKAESDGRPRPKILFMGPRSGGKSSIRKVVFERMAPSDTLFIEKTTKSTSDDVNSFVSIQMWDLPGGQLDPSSWDLSFADTDAVIFVLDAQSTFTDLIRKLALTMQKAYDANKDIQFEIFLHKIDGMSEDYRLDTLQSLRDRLGEELDDLSPELETSMHVFYHLTSVFDTSIYEALSRVIQKLLPQQAFLERLLDQLCQQCSMDKAFLFDTSSKIYIATDTTPLDSDTYVICSDYIDLIGDFTLLYEPSDQLSPSHTRSPSMSSGQKGAPLQSMSRIEPNASSTPFHDSTRKLDAVDPSAESMSNEPRSAPSSRVKLATGATIAQWAINSELSLVALLRPQMVDHKGALIDYNVTIFRDAVLSMFDIGHVSSAER